MTQRRSASIVPFALGLLLVGCRNPSTAAIGEARQALTTVNGLSVNGLSVNGLSVNGMSVNGLSVNGLSVNGMSVNGLSVNGMSVNGMSVNGMSVNGLSVNGLSVNGMSVNGLSVSDLNDNYLWWWALGIAIGNNPDPAQQQGLNAVAQEATVPNSLTQLLLSDPTSVSWHTADGVLHSDSWGNMRIMVLRYLYKIAAAPYHTLTFNVCKQGVSSCTSAPGDPDTFSVVSLGAGNDSNGILDGHSNLGLRTDWERHPLTYDPNSSTGHSMLGEYVISAAMAAHVNAYGQHVTILLVGDTNTFGNGLSASTDDMTTHPWLTGAFSGNLWRKNADGGPSAFVSSGPYNSANGIGFRVCASANSPEQCGAFFNFRGELVSLYQHEMEMPGMTTSWNFYNFQTQRWSYTQTADPSATPVFDAFTPTGAYWASSLSPITPNPSSNGTRPADDIPVAITEYDCAPTSGTLFDGMSDMSCDDTDEARVDPYSGQRNIFGDAGCCSGFCDYPADTTHGGSIVSATKTCQLLRNSFGGKCSVSADCRTGHCIYSEIGAGCMCLDDTMSCSRDDECCSHHCGGSGACVPAAQCLPASASCTSDGQCCSGSCVSGRCADLIGSNRCGAPGDFCCEGGACRAGAACSTDHCAMCGAVGQPCCNQGCNTGLTCDTDHICAAPGGGGGAGGGSGSGGSGGSGGGGSGGSSGGGGSDGGVHGPMH